ncbi:hypothetical protein Ciccas_011264, partial [Cichlidogyrus casuarinus]
HVDAVVEAAAAEDAAVAADMEVSARAAEAMEDTAATTVTAVATTVVTVTAVDTVVAVVSSTAAAMDGNRAVAVTTAAVTTVATTEPADPVTSPSAVKVEHTVADTMEPPTTEAVATAIMEAVRTATMEDTTAAMVDMAATDTATVVTTVVAVVAAAALAVANLLSMLHQHPQTRLSMEMDKNGLWHHVHFAVMYGTNNEVIEEAKKIFHAIVCQLTNKCICDERVLWVRVSGLPKGAQMELHLFTCNALPGGPLIKQFDKGQSLPLDWSQFTLFFFESHLKLEAVKPILATIVVPVSNFVSLKHEKVAAIGVKLF